MTERHHHPNYIGVWVWLALLMLASVLAAYLHISARVIIAIILGLALIKGLLVALYYMHLRFERWWLWLAVLIPIAFALIFLAGTLPDSYAVRQRAPQPALPAASEPTATHQP